MTQQEYRNFNVKNAQFLANLYSRWLCERHHEDINDYIAPMQRHLNSNDSGARIVKMMKRPFGFQFTIASTGDRLYQLVISRGQARVTPVTPKRRRA